MKPYHFSLFKGCLSQILLGPFMNTLSHMSYVICLYYYLVIIIFGYYLCLYHFEVFVYRFH